MIPFTSFTSSVLRTTCFMAIASVLASPAWAAEAPVAANNLAAAITGGKVSINARYRYELVDQAGKAKNAGASTLRTRLGYETGKFQNFSGFLEVEDIRVVGGEAYNDTINGKTQFPVVADPASTEINRATLSFYGIEKSKISFGRDRLILDNARFVGNVGWRQNEQTYDGLFLSSTFIKNIDAKYAYISNVNRVFGDDSPVGDFNSDSHIVNVSFTGFEPMRITAYGYFLDFEADSPANSSNTYGLRGTGGYDVGNGVKLLYTAEYATQTDAAQNTANFDLNYYLIEPGIQFNGVTMKLGYESLEGNGTIGFATPLATLHAHNGWADQFLTTPVNGLEDTYASVGYTFKNVGVVEKVKVLGVYHNFNSQNTNADIGTEWGINIVAPFQEHYMVGVKYASFEADASSSKVDTDKLWLTLGAAF